MFTDPTAVHLQIETHRARVAELAPAGRVRTSSRSWGRRLLHADRSGPVRSLAAAARRRRIRVRAARRPALRPAAGGPTDGALVGSGVALGGRSRLSR